MYYYGIEISYVEGFEFDSEPVWVYALCGWVYEAKTLAEAKAAIKANWREDRTYWKNF